VAARIISNLWHLSHYIHPNWGNTMKRKFAAVLFVSAIFVGFSAPAMGNAPPPTNGGNGAGQSGQCTGNPDGRPASCH